MQSKEARHLTDNDRSTHEMVPMFTLQPSGGETKFSFFPASRPRFCLLVATGTCHLSIRATCQSPKRRKATEPKPLPSEMALIKSALATLIHQVGKEGCIDSGHGDFFSEQRSGTRMDRSAIGVFPFHPHTPLRPDLRLGSSGGGGDDRDHH